jgi:hypothetical protein
MVNVFKFLAAALIFSFCAIPNPCLSAPNPCWRGVHVWIDNDAAARKLLETLPSLQAIGVNQVVMEINYSFEFREHPELRTRRFVRVATAHELAAAARTNGINLIPEFNCLGHQSFGRRACPLLRAHPEFSETPSLTASDKGVYCLSWCPKAPGLNEIIFSLIDEMADGFEATSFHVGMDEVYFIGEEQCPRCHGSNPAELFAAQVNALHEHIVGKKKLKMLMWADRVIGSKYQGICQYDNAHNDLSACIASIPRDIVMCDWHYERKREYSSVPFLAGKGFPVWPSGFMPVAATQAFSDYSLAHRDEVVGYLATTWNETSITNLASWPPIKEILPRWREQAAVSSEKRTSAP